MKRISKRVLESYIYVILLEGHQDGVSDRRERRISPPAWSLPGKSEILPGTCARGKCRRSAAQNYMIFEILIGGSDTF